MQMASVTGSGALDVTKLIDDGGLSRFQIAVVLLCGLVAILDGADTTSIAIAASTIAGLLNFPMSAFGVVFAAGTLGAMLGAMTFGPLADRFGRKRLLIVATVLFAIFTFLIAHANSYSTLVLYRFIAGLGLGGATPCFLALVSEYVPQRLRGTVVSVLWAAFPLGIMLGGFLNSYLVTAFGWQMIFYVGGVVPLVIAALLTLMLPESLQFLIGRSGDSSQAKRILARMAPEAVHRDAVLAIARVTLPGVPVKHLFSEGRALSTVALWIPFFAAFGVLAAVVFFTPALLRSAAGVAAAASNGALVNAFHGLGALLGMALAGRLIDRLSVGSCLHGGAGTKCSVHTARRCSNGIGRLLCGNCRVGMHRARRHHLSARDPGDGHWLGHGHGARRASRRAAGRRADHRCDRRRQHDAARHGRGTYRFDPVCLLARARSAPGAGWT
jgi:AAHS family 4-hydroxybenzoate transporter-like MFS transporter